MIFIKTEQFQKDFSSLPSRIQKKVEKQLRFFDKNSKHPSLHVHQLNDEWEFYVDIHYRCLFRWSGDTVILLVIGTHKLVDRYKI